MSLPLVSGVENSVEPVAEEFEISVIMPCLNEAKTVGVAPITRSEPALIIWREPSGSSLIPASRCKAHF